MGREGAFGGGSPPSFVPIRNHLMADQTDVERFQALKTELTGVNTKLSQAHGQRQQLEQELKNLLAGAGVASVEELEQKAQSSKEAAEKLETEIRTYISHAQAQLETLDTVLGQS